VTDFETRAADWLSYEEALARVLGHASVMESEVVAFEDAIGRAVARDLRAPRALPEHDNSAMDGYAVRSDDIAGATAKSAVKLSVLGEALPGSPWTGVLSAKSAIRIMTGAAVPRGADSVVRVEHTDGGVDVVRVNTDADGHRNVRPAGEDMREGDVVVPRGTTLSPGHVAVLTSTGHLDVPVTRVPEVALLSTGDELLSVASLRATGPDPGARAALWADRVVDSNTPMLRACTEEAGGHARVVGIARDDRDSLHEGLDAVGLAELLVTTGGASMGTHDLLKRVMDERGFRQDFWRVRIRPGSPVSLGFLPREGGAGPLPVFGLPGNPASAFVTFELFVRPYLRALAGHARLHRQVVRATAAHAIRGPRDLTVFLRATLTGAPGAPVATLTGPQSSGLVSSLGQADGLTRLDEGTDLIEAGDPVNVLLLRSA